MDGPDTVRSALTDSPPDAGSYSLRKVEGPSSSRATGRGGTMKEISNPSDVTERVRPAFSTSAYRSEGAGFEQPGVSTPGTEPPLSQAPKGRPNHQSKRCLGSKSTPCFFSRSTSSSSKLVWRWWGLLVQDVRPHRRLPRGADGGCEVPLLPGELRNRARLLVDPLRRDRLEGVDVDGIRRPALRGLPSFGPPYPGLTPRAVQIWLLRSDGRV